MKSTLVLTAAMFAALLVGCNASSSKSDLVTPIASQSQAGGAAGAADPHAGVTADVIPAGAGHKAKVLDVLSSGGYSYIQVDENGKTFWVATLATQVAKGNIIEFPDVPSFPNFESKTLNRTFDSVMLVSGIRDDGPSK